jgi:hypothetical protein
MPPDPEIVDADYQVVNSREPRRPKPSFDFGLAYLGAGLVLGGLTSVVVFIGGWIYCLATYGFLLGGSLGWIPSGIAASIAGTIVRYLWGPIAVVGLIAFASANSGRDPHSGAAAAPYVAPESLQTTALPSVSSPPAVPERPPPPSATSVDKAITDFGRIYSTGGMAGAVTSTMSCYAKLTASSAWTDWDYCAAFDRLGLEASQRAVQQYGWAAATEYFADNAVSRRQVGAATAIQNDWTANQDRVLALKTIVDQAVTTRAQQEAAARAFKEAAAEREVSSQDAPAETPSDAGQSVDCANPRTVSDQIACVSAKTASTAPH